MSTIIFPSPIFGPVRSRRLGISLGINLMPSDGKICTFDCIYCECGFNKEHRPKLPRPSRKEVSTALRQQLIKMQSEGELPDVLTFAGNGEPTAHPDFSDIIDDTIALRDEFCASARPLSGRNEQGTEFGNGINRFLQRRKILQIDCILHKNFILTRYTMS